MGAGIVVTHMLNRWLAMPYQNLSKMPREEKYQLLILIRHSRHNGMRKARPQE